MRPSAEGHMPESCGDSKEPLTHSESSLAFRAVHTQGATMQTGWPPFKASQRRLWIALKAPTGAL